MIEIWYKNHFGIKMFLRYIEQYVEFKMSVLISPSKSLISSRWVIYCFDQQLKNHWAYLNSNAMFEFLGQFADKMHVLFFKNGVDNFEIEHKTYLFLVRGAIPPYRHTSRFHIEGTLKNFKIGLCLHIFATKWCQNPPLPGLLVHALPVLNHDWTDHNTAPMEHWCIATVAWNSCYVWRHHFASGFVALLQEQSTSIAPFWNQYILKIKIMCQLIWPLRVVEWVALIQFLFGVCHY